MLQTNKHIHAKNEIDKESEIDTESLTHSGKHIRTITWHTHTHTRADTIRWSERQIRVGQECQTYSEHTHTHTHAIYSQNPTEWKCHVAFCTFTAPYIYSIHTSTVRNTHFIIHFYYWLIRRCVCLCSNALPFIVGNTLFLLYSFFNAYDAEGFFSQSQCFFLLALSLFRHISTRYDLYVAIYFRLCFVADDDDDWA